MRAMTLIVLALPLLLQSCAAPPTVNQTQSELVRNLKQYIKETKKADPDLFVYHHDEFNTKWAEYWDDGTLEMLPEQKKWHDLQHELWIYQVVPRPEANIGTDVLWIFVDRRTGDIRGELETR